MASPRTVAARRRSASPGLAALLLACGPGTPADATDADVTTSPATTSGTDTQNPGTTPTEPTTTSTANTTADPTGPVPPPIRGEWVGTYTIGFGAFYWFDACGSDERWWMAGGLPDPLICHQQPLWLRVQGEVSFAGENAPEITVEAILDGPCTEGTCDGSPFAGCNTFDALCLNREQECDLFVKPCPPDTKCTFLDPDTLVCAAVSDDGLPAGSPCTTGMGGVDDCDATSVCWDGDPDTATGTCMAYCTGTQDAAQCADPDAVCAEFAPDVFRLCIPRCDPLVQDCPVGQLCTVEHSFLRCMPDQSDGVGTPGAPCEAASECNVGLLCANPSAVPCEPVSTGCCTEFCDLDAPACTLPGQTCVPWWFNEGEEVPPELADLGFCSLPG